MAHLQELLTPPEPSLRKEYLREVRNFPFLQ